MSKYKEAAATIMRKRQLITGSKFKRIKVTKNENTHGPGKKRDERERTVIGV